MEKSEEAPVKVERTRRSITRTEETPKPQLRSDVETLKVYQDILLNAPDMPTFTSMEEVTKWLDNKYRPFLQAIRHEMPK